MDSSIFMLVEKTIDQMFTVTQSSWLLLFPFVFILVLALTKLVSYQSKNDSPGTNDTSWHELLPLENSLKRFRTLLIFKISLYVVSATLLVAYPYVLWKSNISFSILEATPFIASSLGLFIGAFLSYHHHQATWTSNIPLQVALLTQIVALAFQVYVQWTSHSPRAVSPRILLMISVLATTLTLILECIARISKELNFDRLPPEINVNLFSYISFSFAQPFFTKAFALYQEKRTPDVSMLWPLSKDLDSSNLTEEFEIQWELERATAHWRNRKPRLWLVLLKLHWRRFVLPIVLSPIQGIVQFANPNLLTNFLHWLEETRSEGVHHNPKLEGLKFALGFLVVRTLISLLGAIILFQFGREILAVRATLMAAVYRKSLRLSPEQRGRHTIGDIISHVTSDAESVTGGTWFFPIIFGFIPTFALGVYFLHQQMGWAAFVGLAWIVTVVTATQGFNSKAMASAFEGRMQQLDKRNALVDEVVSNIKTVKLSAWEKPILERIRHLRELEMGFLRRMAFAFGRLVLPTYMAQNGAMLLMITIYSLKISVLTPATIFVSLNVLEILYRPIEQIGFALGWFLTLYTSFSRLSTFLDATELDPDAVTIKPELENEGVVVSVEKASFTWVHSPNKSGNQFLLDIPNLQVRSSELLAIVGRVGSGKSSLLQALLGQMHIQSGTVFISNRHVAYCPQVPFILSGTVRDNIVGFDLKLNSDLLDRIIDACALRDDLRELPGGLNCGIGEKGVNLSGGQRSRISLARACYSAISGQAKILVLDSVLEAVDAETDAHLWENVIGNHGILKDFTRVLVSHTVHHLHQLDRICYLDGGRIRQVGTHKQLLEGDGPYRDLITEFSRVKEDKEPSPVASKVVVNGQQQSTESGDLYQAETLRFGRISPKTYLAFFRYAGWGNLILIVMLYLNARAFYIGGQFWLSRWINSEAAGERLLFYLGIYSIFAVVCMVAIPLNLTLTGLWLIFPATRKIYDLMIGNVLRAPMAWFNVTPSGSISSRLCSDISTMDWSFVGQLASFLAISSSIISSLVASSISTRGLVLTLLPVLCPIYWKIFLYYTATSRSVRRLDAGLTQAPILSQASETLHGVAVIKAIGATDYISSFFDKINLNQSAKHLELVALSWLEVRLEVLASLLVFAACSFAIILRDDVSPALSGLALSAVLSIASILTIYLQMTASMESMAVHAERCLDYTIGLPTEAIGHLPQDDIIRRQDWPQKGHILFKNVSVRYRPELPPSIQEISLDIPPGSKVAIVGRTGSGKSTLTLTLLRILEVSEGHIEIDDVNISVLGLETLRKAIAIIPQENQAMAGTIRSNLDPFKEHSDERLWDALETSHLKGFVSNLEGQLDAPVQVAGKNFSSGQLQQLGLARALLVKTKIVVLDEATSALDHETDSLVQQVIRTRFKEATVITIAHRLRTVMDSDMVVVMKSGRIGEQGSPSQLLNNPDSLFYKLAVEAGEIEP